MKRKLVTLVLLVCMSVFALGFAGCASAGSQRENLQKNVIIFDIPTMFIGMYCNVSLAVYDENGIFDWLAWSQPVLINDTTISNLLMIDTKSGKTNEPFRKNGEFHVYLMIQATDNQGFPNWQGYKFNFNMNQETNLISWYDFSEAAG
ncbi:MAG: hypothetical protein FWD14_01040 [Treponema sp.]|nr:hypothetical protein [Treponema sp.]